MRALGRAARRTQGLSLERWMQCSPGSKPRSGATSRPGHALRSRLRPVMRTGPIVDTEGWTGCQGPTGETDGEQETITDIDTDGDETVDGGMIAVSAARRRSSRRLGTTMTTTASRGGERAGTEGGGAEDTNGLDFDSLAVVIKMESAEVATDEREGKGESMDQMVGCQPRQPPWGPLETSGHDEQ